jgi:hypothetical protein
LQVGIGILPEFEKFVASLTCILAIAGKSLCASKPGESQRIQRMVCQAVLVFV